MNRKSQGALDLNRRLSRASKVVEESHMKFWHKMHVDFTKLTKKQVVEYVSEARLRNSNLSQNYLYGLFSTLRSFCPEAYGLTPKDVGLSAVRKRRGEIAHVVIGKVELVKHFSAYIKQFTPELISSFLVYRLGRTDRFFVSEREKSSEILLEENKRYEWEPSMKFTLSNDFRRYNIDTGIAVILMICLNLLSPSNLRRMKFEDLVESLLVVNENSLFFRGKSFVNLPNSTEHQSEISSSASANTTQNLSKPFNSDKSEEPEFQDLKLRNSVSAKTKSDRNHKPPYENPRMKDEPITRDSFKDALEDDDEESADDSHSIGREKDATFDFMVRPHISRYGGDPRSQILFFNEPFFTFYLPYIQQAIIARFVLYSTLKDVEEFARHGQDLTSALVRSLPVIDCQLDIIYKTIRDTYVLVNKVDTQQSLGLTAFRRLDPALLDALLS